VLIRFLLNIAYAFLLVLVSPWVVYRMVFQRRYRVGWGERFGYVRARHDRRPCIWIHAVSMGEINAIGTLVGELEQVLGGFEIVISTTTDTGYAQAVKRYGASHRVFFFPFDFSCAVGRAFDRLRPALVILMELEVWHNFTSLAAKRGIGVLVANGRISSAKGFARYRRIAWLVRPMFGRLSRVLAQDETYAERFAYLGVPRERIEVVGSLKYDTADCSDRVAGAEVLAEQLGLEREGLLWVAGSTGPGEEALILEAFGKLRRQAGLEGLRLAIIPRKPERFEEAARLIEGQGYGCLRYSWVKAGEYEQREADREAVILGDTMGDLRKFYSLGQVVFVGRSLVPMGGSDMIEAAALAKAVVVGPYTDNFVASVRVLVEGEGIEVVADAEQLDEVTGRLLREGEAARAMGRRGRAVVRSEQGATRRTVGAVLGLLGYQGALSEGGVATPTCEAEKAK